MPVQTNETLRIIAPDNACFGTIRFTEACTNTSYQYNIAFKPLQIPSIYYAESAERSHQSVRLRPLHEHGFCPVDGGVRLYFAVAGLNGRIRDLQSALATGLERVAGPIYRSKYYVFVRLGVNKTGIQNSLQQLIQNARGVTTDEFRELNSRKGVPLQTEVVYVTQGALQGTFWAINRTDWADELLAPANGLYRPLELIDFRIGAPNVDAAEGEDIRDSLALAPNNPRRLHFGHTLIDPTGLQSYYLSQTYPSGGGGPIAGATLWQNLPRLGSYSQRYGLSSNAVRHSEAEIMPGRSIYAEEMFKYFPARNKDRDPARVAALQLNAVTSLIANFTNN